MCGLTRHFPSYATTVQLSALQQEAFVTVVVHDEAVTSVPSIWQWLPQISPYLVKEVYTIGKACAVYTLTVQGKLGDACVLTALEGCLDAMRRRAYDC